MARARRSDRGLFKNPLALYRPVICSQSDNTPIQNHMDIKEIASLGEIKKDVSIWIITVPLHSSCPKESSMDHGLESLSIRFSLVLMFLMDDEIVESIISIPKDRR